MDSQESTGRFKRLVSTLGLSDLVGFIAAAIGGIVAVCSSCKAFEIDVICIVASQVLLLIGWFFIFRQRYKYKVSLAQKDKDIDNLKKEASDKCIEYNKKELELKNDREKMVRQLFTMSGCVKSNNIHNNDMLVKIPSEADEQYALLEKLKDLSGDADPERRSELQDEAVESAKKYAQQLFELFNRYCRETTDETVNLQNAYLSLKGLSLKVSVTIKLMNCPYHPNVDRNEDIKVYTAFRDNKTYNLGEREIGEQQYTIGGNTSFISCLTKDYFIINGANDKGDSYLNEHRGFDQIYNAAIVVPIRIKRGNGQYKFFGYLCCDCLNPDSSIDAFDKSAAQYLFAFAQNMATFLETLDANWIDRYKAWDNVSDGILEMLYKKIFKPK